MSADATRPPLTLLPQPDLPPELAEMVARNGGTPEAEVAVRSEYANELRALAFKYRDQLLDAVPTSDADAKVIATLQARAALAGYELVRLADGCFIASRWGMFRSLDHIAAVEAFLVKVGAQA